MPVDAAKARELFLAALDLPTEERAAYLDSACAGDAALRQRLEIMLRSHEDSGELLPRSPAEMLADGGVTEEDGTGAWPRQSDTPATLSEPASEGPDGLPFLAPPAKPGHLGRLAHYEVQEVLGRGGFGIVLRAFDEKLHRAVAIKVLAPAYATVGSARERFIREARAAAAVKNEHVVAIYNVQDEAQPPYLVMELIDGMTLQDKLDKRGPLAVKEILRIGMQTAEGLAAAHRQGLVHRDIKPANILLENGVERVKLTDFGLARAVDDASVSQSGTVAGTPMYMSPEQAEGLAVDPRSDLFSLGSVLYAMCTGHPPFRASGTHAVLKRVIEETPRPIPEVNPEIPAWLCDLIARLHAKKPAGRFQTASEVADLLGQHLAHPQQPGQVPKPPPVGQPDSPPTTPSKRRRLWLSAAALVSLALLGIWFGPWLRRYALNTGYLWVNGNPRARVKLVRAQDGAVIEQGNLAWWGRALPPGDYVLEADYDRSRWVCEYLIQSDFPLAGSATMQQADRVSFAVVRGEYVTVSLSLTPRQPSRPAGSAGWVQLFNGQDLTGWKLHPEQPGDWKVEGGLLVGRVVYKPSHLFSERGDFENFHLRVEAKLNDKGDSGLLFRCEYGLSNPDPGEKAPLGYEANICFLNDYKTGSLWGADWPPLGPRENLITPDAWFTQEVIAQRNRIVIKVNGKTTVDFVDRQFRFRRGHLALQAWALGTVVHFRKVEIRELPPAEAR